MFKYIVTSLITAGLALAPIADVVAAKKDKQTVVKKTKKHKKTAAKKSRK